MFSVPSSRKLVYPAVILLAIAVVIRLFVEVKDITTADIIQRTILQSSNQVPVHLNLSAEYDPDLSLEQQLINNYHASNALPPPNPHITRLVSQCQHKPNPRTNHTRLPSTYILNISMIPTSPDDGGNIEEFKKNRYFNPAIIPLPPHTYTHQTPYRYVLLTRLVTDGLHQESHICFADICSPFISAHSASARSCDASDIELLGGRGGIRCVTTPEKLNMPPTPARKCTGAWKTFPNIPGFHDPRLFWTGRDGEVLVEVNSGSAYGCVGLWIVDLRSVWPRLDEVLKRKRESRGEDTSEKAGSKEEGDSSRGRKGEKGGDMDLSWLGAPMRFRYLTEITRNPRDSRSEAEKNWVLFFPSEDEMWVQYDVMGKVVQQSKGNEIERMIGLVPNGNGSEILGEHVSASDQPQEVNATTSASSNLLQDLGLGKRGEASAEAKVTFSARRPGKTFEPPPLEAERAEDNPPKTVSALGPEKKPGSVAETSATDRPIIKGGRAIAQILNSQAYTTPNMTSTSEAPCFDYYSWTHVHDNLNNTGHWHQGSNSLRLVLCAREQLQRRTCLPNVASAELVPSNRRNADAEKNATSWAAYEKLLIGEGLVVHFSIIHRKFNNAWDLPMRYERYFLVWEARRPFRILGVRENPVLFGGERARPWSWKQDVGWDEDQLGEGDEQESKNDGGEEKHDTEVEVVTDGNMVEPVTNTVESQANTTEQSEETPEPAKHKRASGQASSDDTRPLKSSDPGRVQQNNASQHEKDGPAYFTYTPSIAWAFRSQSSNANLQSTEDGIYLGLDTGTLEDEIIIGIGMDDVAQGFVQVMVSEMLGCLRLCPSVEVRSGSRQD